MRSCRLLFSTFLVIALSFGCSGKSPEVPGEPKFDEPGTEGEDADPFVDIREELNGSSTGFVPTRDIAGTGVVSVGSSSEHYASIDDGVGYLLADGSESFLRSSEGSALGSATVGFSGVLGPVAQVVVNFRAQAGTGAGTIRVELYDQDRLVGTGVTHTLTRAWKNYGDVFGDVAASQVSNLRVKILLSNEKTEGGVRLTQLWINAVVGEPSGSDAGEEPDPEPVPDAGVPDSGTPSLIPPPNFKIAFTGDTGTGSAFKGVLKLVKAEGADLLVVEGDMSYSLLPGRASGWYSDLDGELGSKFPVFMAQGNHDTTTWGWDGYATRLQNRVAALGIVPDHPSFKDGRYAFFYKGISFVFLGEEGVSSDATFVANRLQDDRHVWKICNWHKNQNAMQVGDKGNEMGWGVYENCRKAGAIIATAHEHSYERTKTLSNMTEQTVDATCPSPDALCVGRGRTFAFVSGLGGQSIRDQQRCLPSMPPYGCKGEWASIYTSNQSAKNGALFLVFHVDGNPKKGRGYFKTVAGTTVDSFTFTAD